MNPKDYDDKLEKLKNSREFQNDFKNIDKLEENQNVKKEEENLEQLIGKDGEALPLQAMKNQNSFDDTSNPL